MASRGDRPPVESLAVGGQAVMEGVMMRNGDLIATAVRKPDGSISFREERYYSFTKRFSVLGWPFLRGMVNLVEILIIGMRTMIWSSNQSLGEEEEFSSWELFWTLLLALVFSIAIFKFLPLLLATIYQRQSGAGNVLFNLVDGVVKVVLLTGYIWAISFMPDVRRLFQYHGAEHKSINCYESKNPLTVKNVLAAARFHPRCGTTFILFVFFISVLFYLVIPLSVGFWGKLGLRLLLLPLIAGVSYELIRLGGKHHDRWFMRLILAPGMWLQRLTTREPDGEIAAVAIAALKKAVGLRAARRTPRA